MKYYALGVLLILLSACSTIPVRQETPPLLSASTSTPQGQVTLAWDPSPDSWVSGYAIHYGNTSSNYHTRTDAGLHTTITITNLTAGITYFFVATAYTAEGLESLPSNEVSYTVPFIGRVWAETSSSLTGPWTIFTNWPTATIKTTNNTFLRLQIQ